MRFNLNSIFVFAILSLFLINCKKVNLPNPQAESLIGEWNYVSSSGGLSGLGAPDFNGTHIEFKKSGKFIRYDQNNKKINKSEFDFVEGKCIHSNQHSGSKIRYAASGNESFRISNDTLYLDSEFQDGLSQIYTRK
jgi:hypothetical protein